LKYLYTRNNLHSYIMIIVIIVEATWCRACKLER